MLPIMRFFGWLFYCVAGIATFFAVFAFPAAWNYRGANGWLMSMTITVAWLGLIACLCWFIGRWFLRLARKQ